MNKDPLLDLIMIIWGELEKLRQFTNKVVDHCQTDIDENTSNLVTSLEQSFTEQTTAISAFTTSDLDDHLDEIKRKVAEWGNNITGEMRSILKEEIPGTHKEVVKETVKEVSSNNKLMKPWNELFAKFQTSFYADPKDAVFKALGVQ